MLIGLERKFRTIVIGVLLLLFATITSATPLTLNYSVDGTGPYLYKFDLVLDNHDLSWTYPQNFDVIIFGVSHFNSQLGIFTPNLLDLPVGPFSSYSYSNGSLNGPTLAADNLMPRGWMPQAIGESLHWSGTGTGYLPEQVFYWSNLVGTGVHADFELAHLVKPETVPEPATFGLLGVGLLGVLVSRRKRPKDNSRNKLAKTLLIFTASLFFANPASAEWQTNGDTALVSTYFPQLLDMKDVHVVFTVAFKTSFNCKPEVGTLIFYGSNKLGAETQKSWFKKNQLQVTVDKTYQRSERTLLTRYENGFEEIFIGDDELISKISGGKLLYSKISPDWPTLSFDISNGATAIDQVRRLCR